MSVLWELPGGALHADLDRVVVRDGDDGLDHERGGRALLRLLLRVRLLRPLGRLPCLLDDRVVGGAGALSASVYRRVVVRDEDDGLDHGRALLRR